MGTFRLARGLAALSWSDRAALVRLSALMAAAEFGVRTVPVPRLCRWAGATLASGPGPAAAALDERSALSPAEQHSLDLLHRVARHWPFGRGPCLRLALVEARVLRVHRPRVRIGVARVERGIAAHAWVELDGGSIGDPGGFLPMEAAGGR